MAEKNTKPTAGKTRKTKAKAQAVPVVEVQELSERQELAPAVETALREDLIATAAYFKAAQRGFAPGNEIEDWLAAEREFDAALAGA